MLHEIPLDDFIPDKQDMTIYGVKMGDILYPALVHVLNGKHQILCVNSSFSNLKNTKDIMIHKLSPTAPRLPNIWKCTDKVWYYTTLTSLCGSVIAVTSVTGYSRATVDSYISISRLPVSILAKVDAKQLTKTSATLLANKLLYDKRLLQVVEILPTLKDENERKKYINNIANIAIDEKEAFLLEEKVPVSTKTSIEESKVGCCAFLFTALCKWLSSLVSKKEKVPPLKKNASKGERACAAYLTSQHIQYQCEYIIPSLPKKRYDFYFEYRGRKFLLEFDGIQHFKYTPRFHPTYDVFIDRQGVDIIKTKKAISEGYFIIRIDYNSIANVSHHIETAINTTHGIYYMSDINKYTYITNYLS